MSSLPELFYSTDQVFPQQLIWSPPPSYIFVAIFYIQNKLYPFPFYSYFQTTPFFLASIPFLATSLLFPTIVFIILCTPLTLFHLCVHDCSGQGFATCPAHLRVTWDWSQPGWSACHLYFCSIWRIHFIATCLCWCISLILIVCLECLNRRNLLMKF